MVGRRSGAIDAAFEMMLGASLLTDEDVGFLLTRGHHLGRVPKGGMGCCCPKGTAGIGLSIALESGLDQGRDVSVALGVIGIISGPLLGPSLLDHADLDL